MNVEQSSEHLKKMYNKLSYFDQYGNSVFLFLLLTIFVFLVHAYYSVRIRIQPIKDDWVNQRCKPNVIPFAGFINKPADKTIAEFTQENFNYCLQNMLVPVTSNAVDPINYLVDSFQELNSGIATAINDIRSMFNSIRGDFFGVSKDVMGRLINFLIPIQQIIVKLRDTFAKITGVAVSAMYTSLGTYFTLKSLLGSIVSVSIKLLIILASLLILSFAFLPWLEAITLALTILFAISVLPLTIISVFLTQNLGIPVDMGSIPSTPTAPAMSSCFDKDTLIFVKHLNGGGDEWKPISDITNGDVLIDGGRVTATMKLDATGVQMYNLYGVVVSSTHYVEHEYEWIYVSQHPDAKKIHNYIQPYIYCLNTTSKIIPIHAKKTCTCLFFMDWDEVYLDKFDILEKKCLELSGGEFDLSDIHKYLDSGLDGDTRIVMNDKTVVNICDVLIGSILENGEKVYGVVEIDGLECSLYFPKGELEDSLVGSNLKFCGAALEEIEENLERVPRLFHLLTDKESFHIGGVEIFDYNSDNLLYF